MTAAARIAAELAAVGSAERARKDKSYLRSELHHLGVPVPEVRRVARGYLPRDHDALVDVVEDLWQRPVHECRAAAVVLLQAGVDVLGPDDVPLVERLLRTSGTWALVDDLAARVAGPLVERHDLDAVLDRWTADDDVWLRRSALLCELLPLRRGDGDPARFLDHADALLEDRSAWVRKAIGWVLRDTARRRPELVAQWLLPRASRASGLTVREAVKHLPAELRDAVLAARRRS